MRSVAKKQAFYAQRVKLKKFNNRVYLNEDLSESDSKIMKQALTEKKNGKQFSLWSNSGKNFAKSSEKCLLLV